MKVISYLPDSHLDQKQFFFVRNLHYHIWVVGKHLMTHLICYCAEFIVVDYPNIFACWSLKQCMQLLQNQSCIKYRLWTYWDQYVRVSFVHLNMFYLVWIFMYIGFSRGIGCVKLFKFSKSKENCCFSLRILYIFIKLIFY